MRCAAFTVPARPAAMAPGGACPVGRRITLPFRHPAGGLPSLSPVYPAFCLLSCPHPPTPFPTGRGRFLLSYARGFAPCIPGAGGARHWLGFEEAILFGIAGGRRLQLQSITNSRKVLGGVGGFFQEAPKRFPSPCIPGAGGARHSLGFEETILFGIAGGRRLQLQSITNSRKVLGGLGASFKKPQNVSPPLASPGAGGTRHWLGFEEAILLGIAGGRRLQLQSITNLRKVLGGLGASFKKPPTFLRSPVLPFLND